MLLDPDYSAGDFLSVLVIFYLILAVTILLVLVKGSLIVSLVYNNYTNRSLKILKKYPNLVNSKAQGGFTCLCCSNESSVALIVLPVDIQIRALSEGDDHVHIAMVTRHNQTRLKQKKTRDLEFLLLSLCL